jgi:hypothetical protein
MGVLKVSRKKQLTFQSRLNHVKIWKTAIFRLAERLNKNENRLWCPQQITKKALKQKCISNDNVAGSIMTK